MLRKNNTFIFFEPSDVKKQFEFLYSDVGNTKEMNNVIITYSDYPTPEKPAVSETDEEERNWIYENINTAITKIRDDKYTRQAIIYNLHESGLDHNCLSSFHLYYRKNKLNMNVYVRSMNFDKNIEQDLHTFNIVLNKACNELMLDKGEILVFIMSLHKFVK